MSIVKGKMSRGLQDDHIMASKEIIAIETDDYKYWIARVRKEAREAKASGKNEMRNYENC